MYLFDTNIFLEILLSQEKSAICKKTLLQNVEKITISDFSLHSIGVILFKQEKEELFASFISDVLPNVELVTLSPYSYDKLSAIKKKYHLDFDDAYQCQIARENGLTIVTMDHDFKRIDNVKVDFI